MSDRLEQQLRKALRPVDPSPDFAATVMARIAREAHDARPRRRTLRVPWSWLPALAASLAAIFAVRHEHLQRIEEGERAREQLLQALRLTNEKLDRASDLVRDTSVANPARTSDDERQS